MHSFTRYARIAAAIVLALATVTLRPAAADDKKDVPSGTAEGWYAGITAGAVFPGGLKDQPFAVSNAGVTASSVRGYNLGTGPSLGAQGGYQFKNARVEGEFLWQQYSRSNTPVTATFPAGAPISQTASGTDISSYSLFLNGYYDIPTRSRLTPYVGAGVGVTWLDASTQSFTPLLFRSPGLNRSVFAYQAKVGVTYRMSDNLGALLQYRFMGTSSFGYGGATARVAGQTFSIAPANGSLTNHTIELGLRYRL